MNTWFDRFLMTSMVVLVAATIYITVDAMILFNSLDLVKIIGR